MSLLAVGTVAFDKIETPFGKTDKILGGAATYIGLAASYSQIDIGLVSVVGGDFPEEHFNLLKNKGINTDGIEIVDGGKTFFWEGKYHTDINTRDTLATELNVLLDFQPIVPEAYKTPQVLMLGNLHPEVQASVLDQMKGRPKLVVLDTMNFWMDNARESLDKVIKRVDLLTINDEEARQYTEEYSLVKAAKKILEMGPKYLIIKKGEHGALFFHGDDIFFAPAMPLHEVFDPTGAGDSFAGGLCGYLLKTQDFEPKNIRRGIIHASSMASFTVEAFGTERLHNLSQEDIQKRLESFKKLTQYELEEVS